MTPRTISLTTRLGAVVTAAALGLALGSASSGTAAAPPDRKAPPSHLALPNGFQPEGIATGPNHLGYFGSRVDGDIYRLNLRTGAGKVISEGPGTPSVGLKLDKRGRLFVSGGTGGDARVVDAKTGEALKSYTFAAPGTAFINDVILTRHAAWFTDSQSNALYRLPLEKHGRLPKPHKVEKVELTGDWEQVPGFNANGITTTPDHRALLVVNSASGTLYRVRPNGKATVVDLGAATAANGDGLLREGRTLYVVQNQLNQVAVLRLSRTGRSGVLDHVITSPDFDIPTTIARSGSGLYLPNARFTTPPTPDTPYWVTRVKVKG